MGTFYICGLPIGNLEDITLRALRILREVDVILCEDIRHTLKLLNYYEIKNKLESYHEHSDSQKEEYALKLLHMGKNVAMVSDAGMPLVSDPGSRLVKKVIEEGFQMEVIPGASAVLAALVLSGFDTRQFVFMGFPPRENKLKRTFLEALANEKRTTVVYESPHQLTKTLHALTEFMEPERELVVTRELTKKFQEIKRGTLQELLLHYEKEGARGEFTLVFAGASPVQEQKDLADILLEVEQLLAEGIDKKEAFKQKATAYNIPKKDIYNYYEKIKKRNRK